MTRRRPPRPSPAKDWRAVAAERPQRVIPLPIHTGPATVDERAGAFPPAGDVPAPGQSDLPERADEPVLLTRDDTGTAIVLAGGRWYRTADEVRRFAARLLEAADALEGRAS